MRGPVSAASLSGNVFSVARLFRHQTERDDVFANRLLEEHGVASIPTSAFLYRSDPPRCCGSVSRRRKKHFNMRPID